MRDFQLPGRSPVMAMNGMAATSHPLATEAAVACLRSGGSAADAAVKAAAVLCVVEPHMTGLGGDGFAIVGTPDGEIHGLNGSGRSPAALTLDRFLNRGDAEVMPEHADAVTVPGVVACWQALLDRFGRFDLGRLLEPAISFAENGFPVAPRVAWDWAGQAARLRGNAAAARHYLPGGAAPAAGDVHRLPALAATLRKIARLGAAGFYQGEIAADIAATVRAAGGVMTEADLAGMAAEWVAPVTSRYRGIEVAELPPNGQGITALIILNIMECLEAHALDINGSERAHLMLEAARLAYACRDAFICDPARMRVTVEALVSKAYAEIEARRFDPTRRLADVTPAPVPKASTVYLTVVDRDGLAVSLINSIYFLFGSSIATDESGILLQNRGSCFVVDPDHPNCVGPAKRPMHTIIPGFVLRDGRPVMPFGVMGGAYQAMGHAQFVSNWHDYGLDPQAALDGPRLFWTDDPDVIAAERGVSPATVAGLRARGHVVVEAASPHGGGQAIEIDHARGVLIGGSDPRKDGLALGY
ncbi:MAG: gamma-glutamyltransferase [Hyphomicrobiaceae bacterium]|nr:gamma-glutamyltransferase [Hyphomicrobiaceae bacterium]